MSFKTTRTTESTVSFGVSARLVSILGQHLIRDNTVGLMELIKNGYDADADEVLVEMYDLADADLTTIVVQDNGDGMTREILTGPWLTVAHGHKEVSKGRAERSQRGRIALGEKGVGRFAAHKLGRRLELITRPAGLETELVLEIDWDAFEAAGGSIGEVGLRLTERPPRFFSGPTAHGTRVEMTGSRDRWTPVDVKRLQASLLRLTHPRFGVPDFKVTLRCPEYADLENLGAFDPSDRYQFRLECSIDGDGVASYTYSWRDENLAVHELKEQTDLWQQRLERAPASGPLTIQISAWLAREKTLNALGVTREQLKALGGISIYRDGFRILPYGDEGDDWLRLDARRVNDPTGKFGNRQIIGAVGIDQVSNRTLVDKTNREGLQENQAYEDLKKLTLAALMLLENLSAPERTQSAQRLVQDRQKLQQSVERVQQKLEQVTVLQPRPPVPAEQPGVQPGSQPPQAPAGGGQVVLAIEELQEIKQAVIEARDAALKVADAQDEEKDAFLQLIGSGLAAERFVHEMDRQMRTAIDACSALRSAGLPANAAEAVRRLDVFVNSLRNELRILGHLRYVQRSQRARECSVRDAVEFLLLAYDTQISKLDVRIDPWLAQDFQVVMSEAALCQVIDNVLDNAIYWLGTAQPAEGRTLRVDIDGDERTLTISNNGPAVAREIRDRLFQRPFVSTKEEGHGLGMYLSVEIMKRAGGSISLVDEDECDLDGPGFVIRFAPQGAGEAAG